MSQLNMISYDLSPDPTGPWRQKPALSSFIFLLDYLSPMQEAEHWIWPTNLAYWALSRQWSSGYEDAVSRNSNNNCPTTAVWWWNWKNSCSLRWTWARMDEIYEDLSYWRELLQLRFGLAADLFWVTWELLQWAPNLTVSSTRNTVSWSWDVSCCNLVYPVYHIWWTMDGTVMMTLTSIVQTLIANLSNLRVVLYLMLGAVSES